MANLEWIVLDEIIANLDEGRDLKTLAWYNSYFLFVANYKLQYKLLRCRLQVTTQTIRDLKTLAWYNSDFANYKLRHKLFETNKDKS
jgi:hypothetical protein